MAYFSETNVKLKDVVLSIRNILNSIAVPPWVDKTSNRLRQTSVLESGTVTTVTTVTGVTNIDSQQGRLLVLNQVLSAWASCCRARIT